MRAWVIRSTGGLERLELAQVPDPPSTLRSTDVRVALRAAALNHLDLFVVRGLPHEYQFPHILGGDGAGVVAAVGPDVRSVRPGDRVMINPGIADYDDAMYDPFEYFVFRDKDGLLKRDFNTPLGNVNYHIPCHARVQNVGQKTRELLEQVPDTTISTIERCSGHDGTWGIKSEFYAGSMKIGRPVFRRMSDGDPDYVSSDCPIAGRRILEGIEQEGNTRAHKEHPLTLLRIAYGLPDA